MLFAYYNSSTNWQKYYGIEVKYASNTCCCFFSQKMSRQKKMPGAQQCKESAEKNNAL